MPGKITTTRTAHNVTNQTQTIHITTHAPNNSSITVTPSTLTIALMTSDVTQGTAIQIVKVHVTP